MSANMVIVAVRDRAIDAFMRPFFMQTIGQAVRAFADEINRNDKDNALAQHPEDYDLYLLGEFDEQTGRFLGQDNDRLPRQIAVGKEHRKPTA